MKNNIGSDHILVFVEIKLAMQFQISGYHKRVNSSDFGLVSIYGDVPQLVMLLHKTSH